MQAPASLMVDLEEAVSAKTTDQRVATLRAVADLFLSQADRVNPDHVGVFDDVLLRLIEAVETKAKSELGRRLAPVDNAPQQTVKRLASNDDITVAAPVLVQSAKLSDDDLTEIAKTKSQQHLNAIAKRPALKSRVADAIVDRGDKEVVKNLVANPGASISDSGFARLAARAEGDDALAELVGMRLDIPMQLLRQLMLKTSAAVQQRLHAFAPMETREEIHRIVSSISGDVVRRATTARNFIQAQEVVDHLQKTDQFGEGSVLEFAKMRKYEETVVGLSVLCAVSADLMEKLVRGPRHEGLLVACKAADLKWLTVGAVLTSRIGHDVDSVEFLRKAKGDYNKLSAAAAQKILKFCLVRETAAMKGA